MSDYIGDNDRSLHPSWPPLEDDNSGHDTDCDCKACLIDTWHAEVAELREVLRRCDMQRELLLEERRDWRREARRLALIEETFNVGWLPSLPAEGPSLRLKALRELRGLIREEAADA